MKSYFQSAFKILQIGTKRGSVEESREGRRDEQSDGESQSDDKPTLRLMYVVACDGLCVGEHAY